jgi:hypothetical protein
MKNFPVSELLIYIYHSVIEIYGKYGIIKLQKNGKQGGRNMSRSKLFVIVAVAVITASAMISYTKINENQIEDAFLRSNNAQFACAF